jgi:hypothetical protein
MTKLDILQTGALAPIIDKYKTLLILLNLIMLKGQWCLLILKKRLTHLNGHLS